MKLRRLIPATCLLASISGLARGAAAQQCTIDFDGTCPDAAAECGATFNGGVGCVRAGLGLCYDTGSRAYRVTAATSPLVVTIPTGAGESS